MYASVRSVWLDGAARSTTSAIAAALLSSPPGEIAQDFLLGFVECSDFLSIRLSVRGCPETVDTVLSGLLLVGQR